MSDFQKALDNSRFNGVSIPELLTGYFGDTVITKKDRLMCHELAKNDFFIDIMLQHEDTKAEEWLLDIFTKKTNAYVTILTGYNESQELLWHNLTAVCDAITHLPFKYGGFRSMPVFAAEITKNPHAFDIDSRGGKLLQYAIAWLFKSPIPSSPEDRAELYYRAGLMIDDLSNQVLCCGFTAYANGAEHLGWSGFKEKWQPISMPLVSISQTDKITAAKVLVVENPSIFSMLTNTCLEKQTALVCTLGQPNLSVYVLLDMAVKSGAKLLYSGDMDPEGLLIADKLKARYGEKLELICYSLDIYYSSISTVSLSDSRIKKMKKIKSPVLRTIVGAIIKTGKAAYQEAFASHILF